jgi:futalosine hydrolase
METGPGLVNTAQAVTAAIEAQRPDLILMTGCAGAFGKSGMDIGDIGIATEENDAHLGIEPEREASAPEPLPFDLAEFDGMAVTNRIPLDENRAADAMGILRGDTSPDKANIFMGAFVTVATITATDRGADRLYERFRPCMENMEGVAAAHICRHYHIPFLEVRCASNMVGRRDRGAWDLPLACRRSAEAAVRLVVAMDGQQKII